MTAQMRCQLGACCIRPYPQKVLLRWLGSCVECLWIRVRYQL